MYSRVDDRYWALGALLLWAALYLPLLRHWFEASMFRHMILQLPLLAAIGWVWGKRLRDLPMLDGIQIANRWGATGLLIAIFSMTLWMLPRLLDSARLDMAWEIAKFLSVPLLVGTGASLSWHRCPTIARGVIHVEIVATFWRFGWAYLASEERLCLTYLVGDQQRTGMALCGLGALWAVMVAWRPLFGPLRTRVSYVS